MYDNLDQVLLNCVCSATVIRLVIITPAAGYIQSDYAILISFISHLFLTDKKHFFSISCDLDNVSVITIIVIDLHE